MRFPDEAWCALAVEELNDDPDASDAALGWSGDFGLIVERENGPLAIYVGAPERGRLPKPKVLGVAELEAIDPSYLARASEADWTALIDGNLDPVAALVQRRLSAKGDLSQLVARLKYRGMAERWLERLRGGLFARSATGAVARR
jgi:hypothetical protein